MDEEYFHGNPPDGAKFQSSFENEGGFYGNPEEENETSSLLNIGLLLINIPNMIILILLMIVVLFYFGLIFFPFSWVAMNPIISFGNAVVKLLWILFVICANGMFYTNENKQYCIFGYLLTIFSYLCYFKIYNGNLLIQNIGWH